MKAFHIINQLDLVSPGSLGLIFLPPFPENVERHAFEDRFHYVWAGAWQGQPSDLPGGLKWLSCKVTTYERHFSIMCFPGYYFGVGLFKFVTFSFLFTYPA